MALIQNFIAKTSNPNTIGLTWLQPLDFNNSPDELVITRTITHFPMELFNSSFPTKATDPSGVEIFRGNTITGLIPGNISVVGNTLTDTGASFPTSPPLIGRLLRDQNSQVFRIVSNTSTSITLSDPPTNGIYVILPDFPQNSTVQQNFENDGRTQVGSGTISNLIENNNGTLLVANFTQDQVVNYIFQDGAGSRFIIKSNNSNTLTFFESTTPVVGYGMSIFPSFNNSFVMSYVDNFETQAEATARIGTGLEDDTFYYYTGFTIPIGVNVAQAEFSTFDASTSTQSTDISVKDTNFGTLLYNLWPTLYRELDSSESLQDLMQVFGFQFNLLYSLIKTYNLQDPQTVFVNALLPLSEQLGLPSIGFSIGIDTFRREASSLLSAWKLKGSKTGIALFIRILTTWDITNGTGDVSSAISDFLPNVGALRFYDPLLGAGNVRLTTTNPFVAGGRFVRPLPGIIIPGFFSFREYIINIPNVALYVGTNTAFTVGINSTTMTDSAANFGATNSLVGNWLLPDQANVNDLFEITANTSTTITVKGVINNLTPNTEYAVLSPLNKSRFIILVKFLPLYQPFGTIPAFNFT
jgi:hypothetical protein